MRRYTASLLLFALFLSACTAPASNRAEPPAAIIPASTPTAIATPPASDDVFEAEAASQIDVALPTPTPTPAVAALAPDQIRLRLEPVYRGFELPVFLTHAGDGSGRLFVVEKTGKIWVIDNGEVQPTPFLDVSGKITTAGNEQGLLGMAFAPNFIESGHVFINYTDRQGTTVVERYTVASDTPNRADPQSAFTVLTVPQPASNHNAGMLDFGPDGYLYVPLGDGGAANDRFGNGQNPDALLGKILRLDVTGDPTQPYLIPPDNPFVAADWNGRAVRDEIWAIGLRNPWRTSFDRVTGDFWIADVGQNRFEEVNVVPSGAPGGYNFGWPIMEGKSCFNAADCDQSGLTLPVVDYAHGRGDCSVTGGYVYRGEAHPQWQGVYFYGDFCSGRIWALAPDGAGGWLNAEVLDADLAISSFGEDEAGELYVLDYGGGVIYRMTAE
ncbi:PQQ-dependent sugar dehydrogenase [Caldilinea sp.]|uniref:PQQ-dependent sugar dehydrogenase n=1 Tax=Caldilinea sp. TaxID=2293560 RepID=UPI002610AF4C|nr:PQQ-dependent sugar dehydrogenase [uncultured Caldilinea sp.]